MSAMGQLFMQIQELLEHDVDVADIAAILHNTYNFDLKTAHRFISDVMQAMEL